MEQRHRAPHDVPAFPLQTATLHELVAYESLNQRCTGMEFTTEMIIKSSL